MQPEILRFSYDPLGRLIEEAGPQGILGYHNDPLDNLSTLTLPDSRALNHLYYGNGHLHQINLDGLLISDIERDDLHREVLRRQGRLSSCFGYDARGRKHWQFASSRGAEQLSRVLQPQRDTHELFEDPGSYLQRRYHYDKAGELASTSDLLAALWKLIGGSPSHSCAYFSAASKDYSYTSTNHFRHPLPKNLAVTKNDEPISTINVMY